MSDEKGKKFLISVLDASLPRRRSTCLGEGLFAYVNLRPSSYPCLLCLGKGMLRLGELVFLVGFAFASSLPIFLSIFINLKRML